MATFESLEYDGGQPGVFDISPTGIQGPTGMQGITGFRGVTGFQGVTGLAIIGSTGVQGVTGLSIVGATGIQGVTGFQGVTGLGVTGPQGVTGLGSGGTSAPVVLTYNASLTPAAADGLFRACTLTGDATLHPITNPTDGMRWECWFKASGADRNLTFDAAIVIPTDSSFSSPKTMTSGKTYIVVLKYSATVSAWLLVSIVGGY